MVTSDRDLGDAHQLPVESNIWIQIPRGSVRYTSLAKFRELSSTFSHLRRAAPSILYFNSFFTPTLTILPIILARFGYWGKAILVIAPRGEFGQGALARRSGKKDLYLALFRMLRMHRRVTWHATAEHERDDIRRIWGNDAKVVLRENEVLLPLTASVPKEVGTTLKAVYVGRIVEHKGLAIALKALSTAASTTSLDIYGVEEDAEYVRDCKKLAALLPPHVQVWFHGPAAHEDITQIFKNHDLLLMPTAGENFGHVIAEALSVGCSVMTTTLTPWTSFLGTGGGGYIVPDRSPSSWATAIANVLELTAAERLEMRQRAALAYNDWSARPAAPHLFELIAGNRVA